jgi:ATP/ADP translocase
MREGRLLFLVILVLIGFFATSFALTYAQNKELSVNIAPFNEGNTKSPIKNVEEIKDIFINIVKWVYTIFYIVAVLFILIAAYNFLLGGSDESKIKTAKAQLKYAVIAIAIALISTGVATIANNFLKDNSGSNNNSHSSDNNNLPCPARPGFFPDWGDCFR